jgi:hypothetical protein
MKKKSSLFLIALVVLIICFAVSCNGNIGSNGVSIPSWAYGTWRQNGASSTTYTQFEFSSSKAVYNARVDSNLSMSMDFNQQGRLTVMSPTSFKIAVNDGSFTFTQVSSATMNVGMTTNGMTTTIAYTKL